jgi:hypothetical protein
MSDDACYAKSTPTNTTREIRFESNDAMDQVCVVRTTMNTVLTAELNFLLD